MDILSMLATNEGSWIPSDSPALLAILGDPEPDFDAAGFAVRNLGFVQYEIFAENFVQITLFPKRTAPAALYAVQERVLSATPRLFRLNYLDGTTKRWTRELAMNPREAVGQLNRLCGTYAAPANSEAYRMDALDPGAIMSDPTHPAFGLMRKWRLSFYHFDETVLPFMDKHGLSAESMVIGVDPAAPDPKFRYIGDGYSVLYGDDFFLRGVGESVVNQPDKDYGAWVSPFYTEVASTWRPRLDRCVARVGNSTLGRFNYERLILPWTTDSGEIFLTLSSRLLDSEAEDSSIASTDRKKSAKSS